MKKLFLSLMLIGACTWSAGAHEKPGKYKKPSSSSKNWNNVKGKKKKVKSASLNTVKTAPAGKSTARSGKKISGVSKQFQVNLGQQSCTGGNISGVESPK